MEALTKDKVNFFLEGMPNEFSIDELMDRIILFSKIEKGLEQIDAGKYISHEEMQKKYEAWRQK